ncbi:hypothetical protein H4R18_003925 [Coemansia javaensis]|uniref:Uncharacterized protein n=1 Tax=Coemansia javaensis TaxID=2761396 RepID=A0A9W8H928_9FUNG|nr:hypothetical protein H4R18_003925 [Coemansia javaensis]
MQFSDLPDDVVRLALGWAIDCNRNVLYGFNHRLPLLAVCQRWRHMAFPMVYSVAAVRAKPVQRTVNGGPFRVTLGGLVTKSNVRPIASAGCAQTVKRVWAEVHYSDDPSTVLRDAVKFMRLVANEWGGVKSLAIQFRPLGRPGNEPDPSRLSDADVEAVCEAVVAAFPAVSELCFPAYIPDPGTAVRKISGRLAGLYAGQLERVEVEHPVDFPPEVAFKRLKRLEVRHFYNLGDRLPRMDPDVVEVLNLGTWPQSQAWAAFGLDRDSQEIRLPRLKKLRFEQLWDVAEAARRFHLPSLEWLEVRASCSSCPVLERAVLPPRMVTIKINDTQTDISIPGPDDAGLVEPFNSRIKRLAIGDFAMSSPVQLAAVVKYMVLRMPALTWLRMPRAFEDLMEVFVCTYSKRYPHLSYIKRVLS